jgi:hypothetical protein
MLLIFLNITSWLEAHLLPCLFKTAFHFDCPGCFQRSFIALLKGDVLSSLKLYPALLPMLFFFMFLLVVNRFKLPVPALIIKTGTVTIFIIITVSYIYNLIT